VQHGDSLLELRLHLSVARIRKTNFAELLFLRETGHRERKEQHRKDRENFACHTTSFMRLSVLQQLA
jgi:hypothetical protein